MRQKIIISLLLARLGLPKSLIFTQYQYQHSHYLERYFLVKLNPFSLLDSCFYDSVFLNSSTYMTISNSWNVFDCQYRCQQDADCNFFQVFQIGLKNLNQHNRLQLILLADFCATQIFNSLENWITHAA